MSNVKSERVEVTFIIASYNGLNYLADAVRSALGQTDVEVEVVIVDDGSSDGSYELATELASEDSRISCLQTPTNLGPSGARNIGLDVARGKWISILDSDDLIHPGRTSSLIALAEERGADLVADDMIVFFEDQGELVSVKRFLPPSMSQRSFEISLADYLRPSTVIRSAPELGYLKPIIKASSLGALRYNTQLRIAEDDDLVIRLLLKGAKYCVSDRALYFYRKHSSSISHRLSLANIDLMLKANTGLASTFTEIGPPVSHFWTSRRQKLIQRAAFTKWVTAVKAKDYWLAVRLFLQSPSLALWLHGPIGAATKRLLKLTEPRPVVGFPRMAGLTLSEQLQTFVD
jgi:succinoglycan biosynthesis protein ExoO